ncbi:MAG TPA: DUF58 domain-containing protein [Planctomycetes bacterium]|nr:DUF58 domain-containing protein [Planctomycetota bacterium]|tara:strand:+ start:238 stop:1155 length:918 start_codon:yes stop_codon:yes gene_type:complete
MAASTGPDKKYLDPKTLTKISRLDIVARLVVEGFVTGLHRSPYHGFSVEFAEHREYVPGDDIKHIDWKVYGRSDRYYIKQYEEETNLTATLLVDGSESMRYGSDPEGPTKLQYACFIAASLAYLILRQRDSVGLVTFDEGIRKFIPPGASPSHRNLVLDSLAQIEPAERTSLSPVLHTMAERVKRKGLVILISDLFDDPTEILAGLRHFRHRRHEVIVFHVMDHAERHFPFESMTKFKGLEALGEVLCDPSALRQAYLNEVESFIGELQHGCRGDRIDYVPVDTQTPLDVVLTSYLATRAGMKLS